MRVGALFVMRSVVLFVWAGFFLWLLFSGEVNRYIGSRTYWVVIFGAVTLTVAAVAHLIASDRFSDTKPRVKDAMGLVAILLPILIIVFVPKPGLGALAAANKGAGGIVSATVGLQPPERKLSGELTLEEIEYASQSSEYASAVGITEGTSVRLIGFVTHPKKAEDGTFVLARFAIFCCAADAVPYSARVVPPDASPDFEDDQWLKVRGTLAKDGNGFFVQATEIETIDEPNSPYL